MDFPYILIQYGTAAAHCVIDRDHKYNFLNYDVFLSLKVFLILANSADPDEMQHNGSSLFLCVYSIQRVQ